MSFVRNGMIKTETIKILNLHPTTPFQHSIWGNYCAFSKRHLSQEAISNQCFILVGGKGGARSSGSLLHTQTYSITFIVLKDMILLDSGSLDITLWLHSN